MIMIIIIMIINKGPHHRIQDLVLFWPQKIKLKKSSPIIGKFSNRPFFTRYFRLTCLLFFTLMAFFGRGIVLALKELSSFLDSLISLLPPLICIFKVSSAQRKKVSLKTVAQPGVEPSPCFSNFLARTTFVLESLREAKNPGQDAFFWDLRSFLSNFWGFTHFIVDASVLSPHESSA